MAAGRHVVMEGTRPAPTHTSVDLVGVRLPGTSRVSYYRATEPGLEVGSWVLVPTPDGPRMARVVIAPHQVLLWQLDAPSSSIIRRADDRDVARSEPRRRDVPESLRQAGPNDRGRRFGGLGPAGRTPMGGDVDALVRDPDRSLENVRYRQAKANLPRLGQRVSTPAGDGVVVSLQVLPGLVTVRLAEEEREQVFPAAEVRSRPSAGAPRHASLEK